MFEINGWVLNPNISNLFIFKKTHNYEERLNFVNNSPLIRQSILSTSDREDISLDINLNFSRNVAKNVQIDAYLIEVYYEFGEVNPSYTFRKELIGSRISFNRSLDTTNTSCFGKIIFPKNIRDVNKPTEKNRYFLLNFEVCKNNCSTSHVDLQPCVYNNIALQLFNKQIDNITLENGLDNIVYPAISINIGYKNNELLIPIEPLNN